MAVFGVQVSVFRFWGSDWSQMENLHLKPVLRRRAAEV
jgi:hypothetical protein